MNSLRSGMLWLGCCPGLVSILATALMSGATGDPSFTQMPGTLTDIAIGANGDVWALGSTAVSNNYPIYQWNPATNNWDTRVGSAVRIAVGPTGIPWAITADGSIWRRNTATQGQWDKMPGTGKEIAIGAEGSVWLVGGTQRGVDDWIFKWNGSNWDFTHGYGNMITAGPTGTAWAINAAGKLFRYAWDGSGWNDMGKTITQVSTGANGDIYAIGYDDQGGGNHSVLHWNGSDFDNTGGQAVRAAVAPDGAAWVITSSHAIWKRTGIPFNMKLTPVVPPSPPASFTPAGANADICWRRSYGRGVGTIPTTCPAGTVPDDTGLLCYPQCQSGYSGVGPVCWNFPASYGRGWGSIKNGCTIGNEYDTGLCYGQCQSGYYGVGPVCWGNCGGAFPVNCGAACGVDINKCVTGVTSMIESVAQIASNIIGLVFSGGSLNVVMDTAKTAASTAAKAAASEGSKAAADAAMTAMMKSLAKQAFDKAGQTVKDTALDGVTANIKQMCGDKIKAMMDQASADANWDWSKVDPTGIADVVSSFNKPMCDAIPGIVPLPVTATGTSQVFAIDQQNRLWANLGFNWILFPNTTATKSVAVAHDGTIWRLDMNGLPSAWDGTKWNQFGNQAFAQISVGDAKHVWAVTATGDPYRYSGTGFYKIRNFGYYWQSGASAVAPVTLQIKQVSVAIDGTVYAVGLVGPEGAWTHVYQWDPIAEVWNDTQTAAANISTQSALAVWEVSPTQALGLYQGSANAAAMQGTVNALKVAAGGSGEVFNLSPTGQIYRLVPAQGATTVRNSPVNRQLDPFVFMDLAAR